jgi:hypothetical protein
MAGGRRAGGEEYAARVNAASELVADGMSVADASREPAPPPTTVFTVKVPGSLAGRVRAHAAATGRTISSVVTQALEEFLRGRRERPRG